MVCLFCNRSLKATKQKLRTFPQPDSFGYSVTEVFFGGVL
jgi:hypothetical protein